jgi:2-oxoglutarate ferredoxin oxidoreductase subunit alpha
MERKQELVQDVVIKFAGDSGDGMQLTGTQFTNNTALLGADLSTFPDFPAEIRAPQGTIPGVSGFQLRFSSETIHTPGDQWDILVAMNAAALKTNLKSLKKGGKVIINTDGFDAKNLRLANYADGVNPIEDNTLEGYEVIRMDVTKMTREALKEAPLGTKEKTAQRICLCWASYIGCTDGILKVPNSFWKRNLLRSLIFLKAT